MSAFVTRDTIANVKQTWFGRWGNKKRKNTETKLSVDALRNMAKTPIARSAINQIREGILALPWEVVSIDDNENKKAIRKVTEIIKQPNPVDDYYDFIGKLFEDFLNKRLSSVTDLCICSLLMLKQSKLSQIGLVI